MKQIIIAICIGVFAMADELERMESIVIDIKNLRSDYTRCMKDLNSKNIGKAVLNPELENRLSIDLQEKKKMMQEYKTLLDKERLKNAALLQEIDTLTASLAKSNASLEKDDKSNLKLINALKTKEKNEKVKNLKKIETLKVTYENLLQNKDNEILSLKNKIKTKNKTIIVKKEICEDDNPFPKLIMKASSQKDSAQQVAMSIESKEVTKVEKEKIVDSKASTYRLNKESAIYDDIDGSIVYNWENKTSFTSTKMTQSWLEVTGYFVDRKWVKAKETLWVKKVNATKR